MSYAVPPDPSHHREVPVRRRPRPSGSGNAVCYCAVTCRTSPVKAAASTGGAAYARRVSVAENPQGSSHLTVVAPDEALERARPLPSDDDMAIEGLTDEEWDAFEQALADR